MEHRERRERVLVALRQDARLTAAQLAERLALPEDEVRTIIRTAESDHTIRGYSVLLNDNAFAHPPVRALIEVSVQPERDAGFDRLARQLSRFPEVTDVQLVSGNYDLLLTVWGETLQDVANFVASKLSPLAGVRSTRTHFLLRRYKEAGFQMEEDEHYERLRVTP